MNDQNFQAISRRIEATSNNQIRASSRAMVIRAGDYEDDEFCVWPTEKY